MPARLVALDEGPDIPLDRAMVVVGRHPQCDARLDSLRVSRHHCCMTLDQGDVIVRDLGSTNGIRINGQRVELGRLRPGDELSIAHIRYRLDNGQAHEATLAEGGSHDRDRELDREPPEIRLPNGLPSGAPPLQSAAYASGLAPANEQRLASAAREALARAGLGDLCRIQVILQVPNGSKPADAAVQPLPAPAENLDACRPDSSP